MPTVVRIEHCYVRIEPVRRHSTSLAFRLGRGFLSYFGGVAIYRRGIANRNRDSRESRFIKEYEQR